MSAGRVANSPNDVLHTVRGSNIEREENQVYLDETIMIKFLITKTVSQREYVSRRGISQGLMMALTSFSFDGNISAATQG